MSEKLPRMRTQAASELEAALKRMGVGVVHTFGREEELNVLDRNFMETASRGRIIILQSPEGLGKKTLIRDFIQKCADQVDRPLVIWGSVVVDWCSSPFWPWSNVFKSCIELLFGSERPKRSCVMELMGWKSFHQHIMHLNVVFPWIGRAQTKSAYSVDDEDPGPQGQIREVQLRSSNRKRVDFILRGDEGEELKHRSFCYIF